MSSQAQLLIYYPSLLVQSFPISFCASEKKKKTYRKFFIVFAEEREITGCMYVWSLCGFCFAIPPPLFLIMCGPCHMIFALQPLCIDKTTLQLQSLSNPLLERSSHFLSVKNMYYLRKEVGGWLQVKKGKIHCSQHSVVSQSCNTVNHMTLICGLLCFTLLSKGSQSQIPGSAVFAVETLH